MSKKRPVYTTADPFTPTWWFELYNHVVVGDALAIERMEWKESEYYHRLKKFIYNRYNLSLDRCIKQQKESCIKTYLRNTYDSNNFIYKGRPLKTYVKNMLLNCEEPKIR